MALNRRYNGFLSWPGTLETTVQGIVEQREKPLLTGAVGKLQMPAGIGPEGAVRLLLPLELRVGESYAALSIQNADTDAQVIHRCNQVAVLRGQAGGGAAKVHGLCHMRQDVVHYLSVFGGHGSMILP